MTETYSRVHSGLNFKERITAENTRKAPVKTAVAVIALKEACSARPAKQSLYHAHLQFDGTCKGYERHMRRGGAVRSVYGYLLAILEKHPNPLNYVFPSKRRIQEHTYKWIRLNRKTWFKSAEHYSRRQVYSALRLLTEIGAIMPSQKGWLIRPHDAWTKKVNGVCCVIQLEEMLRQEIGTKGCKDLSVLLAPVLPRGARTRLTVLEDVIQIKEKRSA